MIGMRGLPAHLGGSDGLLRIIRYCGIDHSFSYAHKRSVPLELASKTQSNPFL
jgi:hypothetical protein